MKCYRLPVLLLVLLIGISPIFSQTSDVTEGCAPFSVIFDAPDGSTSYFWDFGDAVTSTLENPEHQFLNPGTYTTTFRESAGGPIIGSIEISVYSKPTLDVTPTVSSGCAPLSTVLNSNVNAEDGINIFNYQWSFGDGTDASGPGLQNASHTYMNPGSFDVFLEIETNLTTCNLTAPFEDLIMASGPPNVSFLPVPATSCTAPLTVNFGNTTPGQNDLNFDWDFGNGNTSTDLNPTAQTYTSEGTFEIMLTATDANGCSGTSNGFVSIGAPLVDFELSEDTICLGAGAVEMINNSGSGTYLWTFGEGAFPTTSTMPNPLVQFNQAGTIDITLEVTSLDGQCSGSETLQIFVDDPDASFISVPTYSCDKTLTATFTPANTMAGQYIWTFDETGDMSNDQNPTYTYMNEDATVHGINGLIEFTTTLTVVNPSGCFATTSVVDTIHQPNALFYPDVTQGCAPLTVEFENRSTNDFDFVTFEWDFGDGNSQTVNNDDNQTNTYTQAGEYEVVLIATDELGCTDTSFVQTIYVGEQLTPDFDFTPVTICPGDSVTLEALSVQAEIDGWHFFTDGSKSFHCFQESMMTHVFDSGTGTFDVTLEQEYNGCYSQTTIEDLITVQGPIAQIDYLVDCDNPYDISFIDSSMEASSITWDFGDMSTSTMGNTVHTYADTGSYQVILTAENLGTGCPASSDTATVHVRDIRAAFALDSFLCLGVPYDLDAVASKDVHADCYRGYTWSFSDPNDRPITTQDTVVEHVFEMQGINFVYLETRDINGCLAHDTVEVKVFGVYPSFEIDPTPICIPSSVDFTDFSTADTTIVSWMWDFGDGNMSEDQNPSNTFITAPPSADGFQVTLSTQDEIGCGGEFTLTLPVYVPESQIMAAPSLDICVDETIEFSATDFTTQGSNLSFDWDFGNSQTSTNQTESITYTTPGEFTVTLDYFENGTNCSGPQQEVTVNVQAFPTAAFNTGDVNPDSVICAPKIVTFTDESISDHDLTVTWDFGDMNVAEGDVVTNGYSSGDYTVTQTVITSNGCSDMTTVDLSFVGPDASVTYSPSAICQGDTVFFEIENQTSVGAWQWDFGDGTTESGGSTAEHVYTSVPPSGTTIASIILTGDGAASMCEVTYELPLSINAVPDITAEGAIICNSTTIPTVNVTGGDPGVTYSWTPAENLTNPNAETSVVNGLVEGVPVTFTVVATSANGVCSSTDEAIVEIIPPLILPEAFNVDVCPMTPIVLPVTNPSGLYTYDWVFSPTLDPDPGLCDNCNDPVITIPGNIGDTLTVTLNASAGNNGCEADFNYQISILDTNIPNAFTPDGDSQNDFFNIGGTGENITITKFQIFNRWGQLVYDNETPTTGWDGYFNGKPAASDVYLFVVETDDESCRFVGDVTLIR